MLPKTERLNRHAFTTCFQSGRRVHHSALVGVVCPSDGRHGSVVVSKKVARQAVQRNTLRRRVYAQLRSETEGVSATFILILKPAFTQLSRAEQRAVVTEVIGRMKKST